MRTPAHFTPKRFMKYIYICAIRDRETFLESLIPAYGDPSPEDVRWINETKAEIAAMKERMTSQT